MFGKTPVTALEEYCAKKNIEKPQYQFINSETDKSFVCRVTVLSQTAEGVGRSKKEGKHDAAANMIKKLKLTNPDIGEIPQAPHETISITDTVAGLRDLCIQLDHPLPSFEIVQRSGPPEAPEFTVECSVATIKRFGMASTKKAAKQKAAQQIIEIIRSFNVDETEKRIVSVQDIMEDEEEKNRIRFKTYREYIEADIKVQPGTLISDRHNFFKRLDENKRQGAIAILSDESLISDADKVHQFLEKLQIKHKISTVPVIGTDETIFVELICEFDCCFADTKDNIWTHMIEYFRDMIM